MVGQARSAAWIAAWVCFVSTASVRADTVNTIDGARLVGSIDKVTPKEITLKTKYAGTLTVAMDQVASFATENPMTTQFKDSTTVTGITVLDDQKNVRVANDTLASTSAFDELQASWVAGTRRRPESLFDTRHWVYQLGADLTGKSGNSD